MGKLIPKTIHVQADLKMFHDYQYTSGSGVGLTFTVPEGMDEKELKAEMHEEQRKLARFVTTSEFMKGAMDQSELQTRLETIDNGYKRLRPRTNQPAGTAGDGNSG